MQRVDDTRKYWVKTAMYEPVREVWNGRLLPRSPQKEPAPPAPCNLQGREPIISVV